MGKNNTRRGNGREEVEVVSYLEIQQAALPNYGLHKPRDHCFLSLEGAFFKCV